MDRHTYRQWNRFFAAFAFGQFDRTLNGGLLAGNNHLAGRIEIDRLDDLAGRLGSYAGLLYAGAAKGSMVPGRIQAMSELFYDFIANMIRDNVGSAGKKFFPFIFTLFVFTLFGNILGMLPYGFTFTSHIAVTFAMALAIFS